MESLLEGIEENRLDALYLFITDVLRDPAAFRRFFANLLSVLPHNWSVHRIEVGHEFLKHVGTENQPTLFRGMTDLEALRTLIISDGYVQRKDNGSIQTTAFLEALPRARSLVSLDIHRLALANEDEVDLLASACTSLSESIEDLRLTGLFVREGIENLDPVVESILDMEHLRVLTLSLYPGAHSNERRVISQGNLRELCQLSALQDLNIRQLNLDDEACQTIADVFASNTFLTSLDLRQNPLITKEGYSCMLRALERNFSTWCTFMVDDEDFQGKFNVVIELNQADRGDLVRNFSKEKLSNFIGELNSPTAIWYFLRLHDTVCNPVADFLHFKTTHERQTAERLARKRKSIEKEA